MIRGMERQDEPSVEVLERVRPALEAIFAAFGISGEQAGEILKEACLGLAAKRRKPREPDVWLLRTVVERCRRSRKETASEDPSE